MSTKPPGPSTRHTPQFVSEPLSEALGVRTTLKLETLNPVRSFKGRGADFLVSSLKDVSRKDVQPTPQLVCASTGNFGQAVASAARKYALPLTVYAAENANALKVARMRSLGATVRLSGRDFDDAKLEAKTFAREAGAMMLEDGLNPEVSEGTGTMGLELLTLTEMPEVLLVPLGNGALLSGVALALKAARPDVKIIGVQAEGAPAMVESWRAGRVVVFDRVDTIADGIAVRLPVPEALEDMCRFGRRRAPSKRRSDLAGAAASARARRCRGGVRARRKVSGGARRDRHLWRECND